MKQPKTCIFCNKRGGISKEHFWPEWLAPYLPRVEPNLYVTEFHSAEGKQRRQLKQRSERQGPVNSKTIRVVCATCNNGWMSILESEAKPIILGLLDRSNTALSNESLKTLAIWVAVKSIIGEHAAKGTALTTQADRYALFRDRVIPNYFRIFIAYHSLQTQAAYYRHSTTVSTTMHGPNPSLPNGISRNIQSTTFLVGSVCIFVAAVRAVGFISTVLDPRPTMHKLWPDPVSNFDLTTLQPLDTDEIAVVEGTLDRLVSHSNVRYGGPLPQG